MSAEELFAELRKLTRVDKLRAMQLLLLELAAEEDALLASEAHYDVWSPFDAYSAAEKLMDCRKATRNTIVLDSPRFPYVPVRNARGDGFASSC